MISSLVFGSNFMFGWSSLSGRRVTSFPNRMILNEGSDLLNQRLESTTHSGSPENHHMPLKQEKYTKAEKKIN